MTANGANEAAPATCVAASARALQQVMENGHVFIDQGGRIVKEYRRNLSEAGQPGPGDAFLKWLLTNEWRSDKVTRVPITEVPEDSDDFIELPRPPDGISYDPSDRKFLAVAAAHSERPPILQAFDSKWWGWRSALAKSRLTVHFLCAEAIAKKHAEKMGA